MSGLLRAKAMIGPVMQAYMPAVILALSVVMAIAVGLNTFDFYRNALHVQFEQAPEAAQAFLTTLGTPPTGAVVCRQRWTAIYCDASVDGRLVTLVCGETCHLPVP